MDKQILTRMKEVEKVVLDLDESVRGAAFLMMQEYVLGVAAGSEPGSSGRSRKRGSSEKSTKQKPAAAQSEPPASFNGFIDMFDSETESDNAKLIAAHLYREYGAGPFSLHEVRKLAKEGGVTLPERLDRTYLTATAEKRKLFKRAGRAMFRPSVHGESYFKKTYGVKMGTKTRTPAASEST